MHQFAPGVIRADVPAGPVVVSTETDYPWAGTITFTVEETPAQEWTLAVRIPAWSTTVGVTVGGETVDATPDARGYVRLRRTWRPGDTVAVELDMTPRQVFAHHRIDAARGTAALERGPLVYCVEQVDQADGADVRDLAIPPDTDLRVADVADLAGVGRTVTLEAAAVVLSAPGNGLPYSTTKPEDQASVRTTTATAIPYFQWDNRDGAGMRVWIPLHHGHEA